MSSFPENQVEILYDYLPGGSQGRLQRLVERLLSVALPAPQRNEPPFIFRDISSIEDVRAVAGGVDEATQRRAIDVHHARAAVLPQLVGASAAMTELRATYDLVRTHSGPKLDTLSDLDPTSPRALPPGILATALHPEPIHYTQIVDRQFEVRDQGGNLEGFTIEPTPQQWTLEGAGPLEPGDVEAIGRLLDSLANTPERALRFGLLRGEVLVASRDFEAAAAEYEKLLGRLPGEWTNERKLVALRGGWAHAAAGDQAFRASRPHSETAFERIVSAYDTAVQGVQRSHIAIAADNPLRMQLERHVAMQKAKLAAHFNYFGYPRNYLPVVRHERLLELARERITAADAAAQRFEHFQHEVQAIQDEFAQLDFETDVKAKQATIAGVRVKNAVDHVEKSKTHLREIQAQLDSLTFPDLLTTVLGQGLEGLAAGFLAGQGGDNGVMGTNLPGVTAAGAGLATSIVDYLSRKKSLQMQRQIAAIEGRISERDLEIANLEEQIAATQVDFLEERIRRIQARELGKDVYLAAASAFRTLAERHLDAAMSWSFQYERAVAFLRLVEAEPIIDSDYVDRFGLLGAAGQLEEALRRVVEHNVPLTRFQLLTETYSLKRMFPLEFHAFKQTTGPSTMDFCFALPSLDKRRPGVYRARIKHVTVKIPGGLVPETGFTGRLIHRGTFLLRDRDTTPEPDAGRLIPTDEELAAAFEQIQATDQGRSIGGVIPCCAAEGILEISPDMPPVNLTDPSPDALTPLEGYGPAASWRLEIDDVDLRFVPDVHLVITYAIPESDGQLARKVRGLLKTYEQDLLDGDALDLISPFAIRQLSPTAIEELRSGSTVVSLSRDRFPPGLRALELKAIILQLLDQRNIGLAGIAVEIFRPDTPLTRTVTTGRGGFSEDLDQPLSVVPRGERIAAEGDYHLRLPSAGQATELREVMLFVMYSYESTQP